MHVAAVKRSQGSLPQSVPNPIFLASCRETANPLSHSKICHRQHWSLKMASHSMLMHMSAPTHTQRPSQNLKSSVTSVRSLQRLVTRAEGTATKEEKKETKETKKEAGPFKPPTLDASWPSPIFGGSTGGLLRKAQVEEFHVITWEAKKEAIFEMPTGGAAKMRQGPNLLKLSRKEQCLALLTQLRNKFKTDGAIYRVFPNGEVQYLHPKDGVYPEKVNQGRKGVGVNDRRIGQNTNPAKIKFTGTKGTFDV